jgi:hypothetical protein
LPYGPCRSAGQALLRKNVASSDTGIYRVGPSIFADGGTKNEDLKSHSLVNGIGHLQQ